MVKLIIPLVNFAVFIGLLIHTSAITLPNQPTDRPHKPKQISSTSTSSVTTSPEEDSRVATYRLTNSVTGTTCILLTTDAIVEVTFKKYEMDDKADSFVPEDALIDGSCKNEDSSSLRLSWTGYSLVISFSKTPGGELWYIDNIELTVSPDLQDYKGIRNHGNAIKLYHKTMIIPTPVGKSYSCEEINIDLETDEEDRPPPDLRGTLILQALQIQPFMYKSDHFEPAMECKDVKSYRDETAPLAVGTTLAIFVLMTIAGYAVFRHFKVKNVQYNTME